MASILVFAFQGNISEKVLQRLISPNISKRVIGSTQLEVEQFSTLIQPRDYKYVVGLGMYSGKDQALIRIEQTCTSKFRNQLIGGLLIEREISGFIPAEQGTKKSSGIGNSFCNLVSFGLSAKGDNIGFLHIPKLFDIDTADQIVSRQLLALQV